MTWSDVFKHIWKRLQTVNPLKWNIVCDGTMGSGGGSVITAHPTMERTDRSLAISEVAWM